MLTSVDCSCNDTVLTAEVMLMSTLQQNLTWQ
jgi:hypothetical protein